MVQAGLTTTVDFELLYVEIEVDPASFIVNVPVGGVHDEIMTISNLGTSILNYNISVTPPGTDDLGVWTNVTPVGPSVTQWPGSCFGEGKFFVVGGFTDINTGDIYDGIQIYDTAAGTWSASAAAPTNVFCCVSEYYQGKVYVVGGYINDLFTATNLVQIYDIAANSWTTGANMPTARGGNSGGILDGKIYTLGGSPDSNFPAENVAYEYDIATNAWTTKTAGPISTYGISLGGGCEFEGKIYTGGHFSSTYNQFYEFDPAGSGTWTAKAAVPTGIGGQTWSLIGLETEGYIIAVGGGNDWVATGATFKYDPATDAWTNLNQPMTNAVLGGGCAAGYGELYFYGGTIGSGPVTPAPFMMNTFSYITWVSANPEMGSVDPAGFDAITVHFDADAAGGPGTYEAWLVISNNDPNENPINVPVTMNVYDGPTPTPVEPTMTPTTGPTATPTEQPPDIIWVGNYSGCTGDTLEVMVMMANDTVAVDAFTMHLLFDNTMLAYNSCIAGDLDPGWTLFDCNEANPGDVTIAGFSLPPDEIPAGSEGVLAVLNFTVTCGSCMEGDSSALSLFNFRDDIIDFSAMDGLFTFTCTTPTPTVVPPTNTPTATPVPPTWTPTPTVALQHATPHSDLRPPILRPSHPRSRLPRILRPQFHRPIHQRHHLRLSHQRRLSAIGSVSIVSYLRAILIERVTNSGS